MVWNQESLEFDEYFKAIYEKELGKKEKNDKIKLENEFV